jgi:hypothetical protein
LFSLLPAVAAENDACFSIPLNLPDLVRNAKRVTLFSPEKTGSTSMLNFTNRCRDNGGTPDFMRDAKRTDLLDKPTAPQKLLFTRLATESTEFVTQAPDSLIIFTFREERSRLISAIKQVVGRQCNQQAQYCQRDIKRRNDTIVDVKFFIENVLVRRAGEIGRGSMPDLLSCPLQNAIKSSPATFIMIDYTMVDQLQAVLAKEMCPEVIPKLPIVENVSERKWITYIRLKNGSQADELLDDWVDSRVDLLAWALHYRHPGCNSQFRRLQSDFQTCKTKAMRVNDLSYIGDMEVHG